MMLPYRGLGASPSPTVQQALQNASQAYGVPLPLLTAVARSESSYNPAAVSPKGAQGLMQLMPATAATVGVSNPFDPQQSANGGAQYLAQLYSQYGDWNTALIAYNQGPTSLQQHGPYASSQQYAQTILNNAGMDTGAPSPAEPPADIPASDTQTAPFEVFQPSQAPDYTVPVVVAAAAIAAVLLLG